MNLILLLDTDRDASGASATPRFRLAGPRADHIRTVLRLAVGDRLRVGLLGGPKGEGVLVESSPDEVVLEARFAVEVEPREPTDLLLAIPRPKSLKKVLPELAALGLDRLYLFRSWRVDPSYLEVDLLRTEVYTPLLHAGLMQARSTQVPVVSVHPLFRPFVEDEVPRIVGKASRALVAHPSADARLADLQLGPREHVVLAVGPEGGFIPYELDRLRERGFLPVSMGDRTLRVETACVALLAQLSLLRQRS